MQRYINPDRSVWPQITARARKAQDGKVTQIVSDILSRVRTEGDKALVGLAKDIDGVDLDAIEVSAAEKAEAAALVPESLRNAIAEAAANIRKFHLAQLHEDVVCETAPGVKCYQKAVPIHRVGLYIPGGTAPLFSTVLMLAIPAKVAGCPEIVLCTPTDKQGKVNPAVLYAADFCGVDAVYKTGGAQAVAAMAYGTQTIAKVDKIFGPGNRFVMKAKQIVSQEDVSIDMPAGPSEVMVLADSTADPAYVAADLLSQAEHGADSQVVLVSDTEELADKVLAQVEVQTETLGRKNMVYGALEESRTVIFDKRSDMLAFAEAYAPEHLILSVEDPWEAVEGITCAGSVFIGNYSPESAGDYASGTNHTLPTSGWARSCSGVNTESFMRRMTIQELSQDGLAGLAQTIIEMAEAEGLQAHANAVRVRRN